jgi:hypothetical protein
VVDVGVTVIGVNYVSGSWQVLKDGSVNVLGDYLWITKSFTAELFREATTQFSGDVLFNDHRHAFTPEPFYKATN